MSEETTKNFCVISLGFHKLLDHIIPFLTSANSASLLHGYYFKEVFFV